MAQSRLVRVHIFAPDNMTGEFLANSFSRGKGRFVIRTLTGTSQSVLSHLVGTKPDVALISEELQDGPQAGFDVLRSLRASHPSAAAVMLLKAPTSDRVVQAFRGGARGILYRSHSLKTLAKCIRRVHEGQIWAGNEDLEHVLAALTSDRHLQLRGANGISLLTRREDDVVRLAVDGMKNRDIAEQLQVTEHSVRNYIYRIFEKLGVSTRVELILYVLSRGNPSTWQGQSDTPVSSPLPGAQKTPARNRQVEQEKLA